MDGKTDGIGREYSPEGKPASDYSWRRGVRHGRWCEFGRDTPIREGHYMNGKPHGSFTYWYRCSEVKEVTYTTHNGYKHGLLTWYYSDGLVRDVTVQIDGTIDTKKFKNTQWEGLEYLGKYEVVPAKKDSQ